MIEVLFLSEHKLTYYLKHDQTKGNALTKLSVIKFLQNRVWVKRLSSILPPVESL